MGPLGRVPEPPPGSPAGLGSGHPLLCPPRAQPSPSLVTTPAWPRSVRWVLASSALLSLAPRFRPGTPPSLVNLAPSKLTVPSPWACPLCPLSGGPRGFSILAPRLPLSAHEPRGLRGLCVTCERGAQLVRVGPPPGPGLWGQRGLPPALWEGPPGVQMVVFWGSGRARRGGRLGSGLRAAAVQLFLAAGTSVLLTCGRGRPQGSALKRWG